MIRGPPDAPTTNSARPSRTTIVGVMLDRGFFPGATPLCLLCSSPNALGSPGRAVKSSISLFNTIPYFGSTTKLPKAVLMVSVQATAFPSASMIEKCVVPASSGSWNRP